MAKQADICLKNLIKDYPSQGGIGIVRAVDNINVSIQNGEFVTLLGPSGCGKTTILRMLAGFEAITSGDILLNGKSVAGKTPDQRDSAMVFQNYALFPHYNVYDNIAYGLHNRKLPAAAIRSKVSEMLDLVNLHGLENRMPNQLSGGQQQRVALARALVMEPAVLLFDEPLSNLDAKLRLYMRKEIRKLQQRVNITSIYVTHDQSEAMAISDKIIIMNGGHIEQVGTPHEIYEHPQTHFVADFIGTANFIKGKVVQADGQLIESTENQNISTATVEFWEKKFSVKCLSGELQPDDDVEVVIRPEAVELGEKGDVEAIVVNSTYLGQLQEYVVQVGELEITVEVYNPRDKHIYLPGDKVLLHIKNECLHAIKYTE